MTTPHPALIVVYAQNIERVAAFYEQTLSGRVADEEADHVLVAGEGCEVAVVRMPPELAAARVMSDPPRIREENPLKPSFWVDGLARVRAAAQTTGGTVKPATAEWIWRGQVHVDGSDPEGNPVQFRSLPSAAV